MAQQSDEAEEKKVEERTSIAAHVVHEAIRREGEEELERMPLGLALSGLAAGLSMGFSLVGEGLLRAHLPDVPWRELISKLGYSFGFVFVILGRQQLFTENTLTPILPLLTKKDLPTLAKVARLWVIVLLTNLVGASVFGWSVVKLDFFSPEVRSAFLEIGRSSLAHDPAGVFLRAIIAGWLIALMVWLLPAAEQQLPVVVFVTYLVGLGELSHVIAGTVETWTVIAAHGLGVGEWTLRWLLPTLAGNILGGLVLVALLNHGQVVAGQPD